MKKHILILALILALCMPLSGCKKQDPYADIPNPIATITMEDGSVMQFELFLSEAPNTVANFVQLANSGFYDGLSFHRIVSGVLIQSGDPVGDGTGNAGHVIQGEFAENGIQNSVTHSRGTISMSRHKDDYDSASSQFFIMQGSHPSYDGQYAAFGRAVDENTLAVIDAIAMAPVDGNYSPVGSAPRIATIRVETYGYTYEAQTMDFPEPETIEPAA